MQNNQAIKKAFFNSQYSFFDKKVAKYRNDNSKDIISVFSSIVNMPQYSEIRKRFRVHKAISRILLDQHLGYIIYATYRADKLIIMARDHVGQMEISYQKMILLKYLEQIKEFKNIKSVSVLRWDKEKREQGILEFSLKKKEITIENPSFKESSNGIFENNFKNKRLYNIMEDIRNLITKNQENNND
ncbi:hypothetical protein MNB_ARC-1_1088 [hydrothermal vent metagenome]|uniref:DUF721 domain-containing protein n=1 Tax=hydrothermal vent metagenome TaxID=652676 RepID=A0A3B1E703_9ZZZZ